MTTISPVVSERTLNFSAGPATLPDEVVRQAQHDLWDIDGTGIGIMEHSHRGATFDRVLAEAEADCRELAGLGDDHVVLFLQGGATMQFAMIPVNFLPSGRTADYLDTGEWASKAYKEAQKFGAAHLAFDGKAHGYHFTPSAAELSLSENPAYVHYCANNTIAGTQFPAAPDVAAPLIADTSSEMFSRPFAFADHAMIYAGAQKNLGPSGVALVILRKDFLDQASDPSKLPTMFDYRLMAEKGSRYNTPPTFGIYVMGLVFKWILNQGGLDAMAARNERKAAIIYDAVDGSGGFYTALAREDCRSLMNVGFRTTSEELDAAFVKEALAEGMSGLKGHRSVGGLRASIYNAFPEAGCTTLASFMADFASRHG